MSNVIEFPNKGTDCLAENEHPFFIDVTVSGHYMEPVETLTREDLEKVIMRLNMIVSLLEGEL